MASATSLQKEGTRGWGQDVICPLPSPENSKPHATLTNCNKEQGQVNNDTSGIEINLFCSWSIPGLPNHEFQRVHGDEMKLFFIQSLSH